MTKDRADTSKNLYQHMKPFNTRMVKNYQRGFGPTRITLLLTTTGRKSGLPRTTPLQYEEVDGDIYVGSALGADADWFKNICMNPNVHVRVQKRDFDAIAEPVVDAIRIADFIELRLHRHPIMIRLIMWLFDGLPLRFSRGELVNFSRGKAMAIIHLRQYQFPIPIGVES